jgi:hypothetical protein
MQDETPHVERDCSCFGAKCGRFLRHLVVASASNVPVDRNSASRSIR